MIEVTWAKSTFIYFGIAMNYPLNKEANFCFAVHEACLLDLIFMLILCFSFTLHRFLSPFPPLYYNTVMKIIDTTF